MTNNLPRSAQQNLQRGDDFRNLNQVSEAVAAYELVRDELNDHSTADAKATAALAVARIGVSYSQENNREAAMAAFEDAIGRYHAIDSPVGVGQVQCDVGILLARSGEYDEALGWLMRSHSTLCDTDDENRLVATETKIGMVYNAKGEYTEAREWLEKSLQRARRLDIGKWFFEMSSLLHTADLLLSQQQWDAAITSLWAALGMIYDHGEQDTHTRRRSEIHGAMSRAFIGKENYTFAAKQLDRSVALLADNSDEATAIVLADVDACNVLSTLETNMANLEEQTINRIRSLANEVAKIREQKI
ncbi:MAG: tetratricopeptide repeat protein [Gammaproteobacteria bacterium]|nr:tetratricopeptide repeat protein [Gammaproteobacteria bacterium]